MLLHNYNAQSALDAPRFCITARVPDDSQRSGDISSEVFLEDGIRPEVVNELRKMGHSVTVLKAHARSQFGKGQVRLYLYTCGLTPLNWLVSVRSYKS
jgi:gamma-glutamyltranspeptidase / glutathione hydrolase